MRITFLKVNEREGNMISKNMTSISYKGTRESSLARQFILAL